MTEPLPSPSKPAKARRLPSVRMRCALAAGLFVLGIAVGAAIGPVPQESLAGSAVNPRALIASLLARNAAGTRTAAAGTADGTLAAKTSSSPAASPSGAGAEAGAGSSSSPTMAPAGSEGTASGPAAKTPTPGTTSTGASGEGTPSASTPGSSTSSLPAIGRLWLIVLPGEGMASATAQPASDPYFAQQLVPEGTLLSTYSALDANALLSDAALLSGGSAPRESVLSAPGCEAASQPTCTPGSAAELASVDAWLHVQIPQITASADYKHGLIAIAFTAPGEASDATTGASDSDTTTGTTMPAPTTLAAQPLGVLLLSPFLRKPGGQSSKTFHPDEPRKYLEGLLKA